MGCARQGQGVIERPLHRAQSEQCRTLRRCHAGQARDLHALVAFAGQPKPTAHLLGYLRARHMLLVLDNFEHLLDPDLPFDPGLSRDEGKLTNRRDEGGADLVADILAQAPQLKMLITSRERLNLQAEWVFDIDGLAYPHEGTYVSNAAHALADLTQYSALQLFAQRARQAQSALVLDEATLTTIVQLC